MASTYAKRRRATGGDGLLEPGGVVLALAE
jgi:hypothetical protein